MLHLLVAASAAYRRSMEEQANKVARRRVPRARSATYGGLGVSNSEQIHRALVPRSRPRAGIRTQTERNHDMTMWIADIEKTTLENDNFRTVAFTGKHTQLTLMSLKPGEDIGWESHSNLDQFLRLEQGRGRLELSEAEDFVGKSYPIEDDWAFIVPAGVWHNVVNTGDVDLKLYSLYSPPEHPADTVHVIKAEVAAGH